jgi:hypothetical protein
MSDPVLDVFEWVRGHDSLSEVSHVELFDLYLDGGPGQSRRVRLELHDYGPDAPAGRRYRAVARDDDGKRTTGNAAESVAVALSFLHWPEVFQHWTPPRV